MIKYSDITGNWQNILNKQKQEKIMKLTIQIPKEYEEEFAKDHFKDSLERLIADANCLAGKYEKETAKMLIKAFANAEVEK